MAKGQDVAVAVRLAPAPVEVDSLTVGVDSRSSSLSQVGFYSRQALGVGHFITHTDIDAMGLPCAPVLLLDGAAINPPWEKVLDPHGVEGIEVYSHPSQIPLRFQNIVPLSTQGGADRCGIVVA